MGDEMNEIEKIIKDAIEDINTISSSINTSNNDIIIGLAKTKAKLRESLDRINLQEQSERA